MKKIPFHKFKIEFDEDDKEVLHFGGVMIVGAFVGACLVTLICLGMIEVFKMVESLF